MEEKGSVMKPGPHLVNPANGGRGPTAFQPGRTPVAEVGAGPSHGSCLTLEDPDSNRISECTNTILMQTLETKGLIEPQAVNQALTQYPHQASYSVPVSVGRQNLWCLLDSGCTTNVLSWCLFDTFSASLRDGLEVQTHRETKADGTRMKFLGLIPLEFVLKGVPMREVFAVRPIQEDAILAMPFLYTHQCTMVLGTPEVYVDGKRISCAEKYEKEWPIDQQETQQYLAQRVVKPIVRGQHATSRDIPTIDRGRVKGEAKGRRDPIRKGSWVEESKAVPRRPMWGWEPPVERAVEGFTPEHWGRGQSEPKVEDQSALEWEPLARGRGGSPEDITAAQTPPGEVVTGCSYGARQQTEQRKNAHSHGPSIERESTPPCQVMIVRLGI